jgi:hypothetical protein
MGGSRKEEQHQLEEGAFSAGQLIGGWKFIQPVGIPEVAIPDETGRPWRLPRDREGLRKMLVAYIHHHGLPSKSVDTVFARHGQLNALRVLVARGAVGERINVAARALALGPMPSIRRRPPDNPGDHVSSQWWTWEDARDEATMLAVQAEELRLRLLGYQA